MRAASDNETKNRILIGIVGYTPFIRGYPLGPELMTHLQQGPWPIEATIREMNWGPIAIVQDLQASAARWDRVVLIGATDRGLSHDAVSCYRWGGGTLDAMEVQGRVFEAVTGVVSLDNLLVIGTHFGVWPHVLYTVEMQASERSLGDFVLDEIALDRKSDGQQVIGTRPPTPQASRIVRDIVTLTRQAVLSGIDNAPILTVAGLSPIAAVCHHRFVNEGATFTAPMAEQGS